MRNYAKKYIANFWFVNRVLWLTMKWRLLIFILSNKRIALILSKINKHSYCSLSEEELKALYLRKQKVIRITEALPIDYSCLLSSMILYEILKSVNENLRVNLSIKKVEEELFAHAEISFRCEEFFLIERNLI